MASIRAAATTLPSLPLRGPSSVLQPRQHSGAHRSHFGGAPEAATQSDRPDRQTPINSYEGTGAAQQGRLASTAPEEGESKRGQTLNINFTAGGAGRILIRYHGFHGSTFPTRRTMSPRAATGGRDSPLPMPTGGTSSLSSGRKPRRAPGGSTGRGKIHDGWHPPLQNWRRKSFAD